MDGNFFTVCLREIIRTKPTAEVLLHFLHALECDAEEIQLDERELYTSMSYLHTLYMQYTFSIRAAILRICCSLEINSQSSIFEKYFIDQLVSISLKTPLPEPTPKLDEERVGAFRNLLVQLKGRQKCSDVLARALIHASQMPNTTYASLIFGYLLEVLVVNPDVSCKSEILQILIDKFLENPDNNLFNYISYCLENVYFPFAEKHRLSKLISPIVSTDETKQQEIYRSTTAITKMMKSWAGLLGFVIPSKVFHDLVLCMPHTSEALSSILCEILEPWHPHPTVRTAYTGFILYYLRISGLMDIIKKKLPNTDQAIHILEPYDSIETPFQNQIEVTETSMNTVETFRATMKPVTNTRISIECPSLGSDSQQWDWNAIYNYLTIILANNPKEVYGSAQLQFYNALISYFSGPFLTVDTFKTHDISDSLFALIRLLLDYDWGAKILESSIILKNALTLSVHSLRKHDSPRNDSPAWSHFKCVCTMMKRSEGIKILNHWEIQPVLINLSSAITNLPCACLAMSMLELYPEFEFASPVFMKFLLSPKLDISNIAVQSLSEKKHMTNYFETAFKKLIVPYIKQLVSFSPAEIQARMPNILQLFFQVVIQTPEAPEYIGQDNELQSILFKYGPLGYSYIFSTPTSLMHCNIKQIIEWWMTTGNAMYVDAFDKAIELSFNKKAKDIAALYPGMIALDVDAIVRPPHLFGVLAKHTEGIKLLTPFIPRLINMVNGDDLLLIRQGMFALAHFASSPLATMLVSNNDIHNVIFKCAMESDSMVLRGTLLNCFTIIGESQQFYNFLDANGWELAKFGGYTISAPVDFDNFTKRECEDNETKDDLTPPQGYEAICRAVVGLLSPLQAGQCKAEISKYKDQVRTPQFAIFVHKALGRYNFTDDVRRSLEGLVEGVPLMQPVEFTSTERAQSEARARIAIIAKRGMNEAEGLRKFPITTDMSPRDMAIIYGAQNCAEWFLDDQRFRYITDLQSRDELYSLDIDQIDRIRKRIMEQ